MGNEKARNAFGIRMLSTSLALVILLAAGGTAYAVSGYLDAFVAAYPAANGTRIDTCVLCHPSGTGGARNAYGTDFANAGIGNHTFNAALGAANSDGNGGTNDAEIAAQTFPGDANDPAAAAPTITTTSPLTAGTVGTAYNQTFAATGGTPPYSWSVTAGALPAGLTLSAAGVLSGTPTTAGTSNFTVQVTGGASSTRAFVLTINAVGAPTITTASPLPAGAVGTAYNQALAATGGTPPLSWSVTAGALPAGLTLSTAGVLSGTPTTAGPSNFTVTVTGGGTASKAFSLTINAVGAPTITTASTLPAGAVGTAYNQPLAATGGTLPYSWSVTAGSSLPAGLSLSTAGVLSGTPTTAGTFNFSVTVTGGGSSTQGFDLTINAASVVISRFGGDDDGGWFGCAISPSGGGNGGILGTYGPLALLVLGLAFRRRVQRRKE